MTDLNGFLKELVSTRENPPTTLVLGYSSTGGGHTRRSLDPIKEAINQGTLKQGDVVVIAAPPRWKHDTNGSKVEELHKAAKQIAEKGLSVVMIQADKTISGLYKKNGDSDNGAILRSHVYAPRRDSERVPSSIDTGGAAKQVKGHSAEQILASVVSAYNGTAGKATENVLILSDMDPALQKHAKRLGIKKRVEIGNHQNLVRPEFEYRPELSNAFLSKATAAGRYTAHANIDYDASLNPLSAMNDPEGAFGHLGIGRDTPKAKAREKVLEHMWSQGVKLIDPDLFSKNDADKIKSVLKDGGVICPAWHEAAATHRAQVESQNGGALREAAREAVKTDRASEGKSVNEDSREFKDAVEARYQANLSARVREELQDKMKETFDAMKMVYIYMNDYTEEVAKGLMEKMSKDGAYKNCMIAVCGGKAFEKPTGASNLMHLAYAANAHGATCAGFGTTSEYLSLANRGYAGKFIVGPVVNQHEQEANAAYLTRTEFKDKITRAAPPQGVVDSIIGLLKDQDAHALEGAMGDIVSAEAAGPAAAATPSTHARVAEKLKPDAAEAIRLASTVESERPEAKEIRRLFKLFTPAMDSMINDNDRKRLADEENFDTSLMSKYSPDGKFEILTARKDGTARPIPVTLDEAKEFLEKVSQRQRIDPNDKIARALNTDNTDMLEFKTLEAQTMATTLLLRFNTVDTLASKLELRGLDPKEERSLLAKVSIDKAGQDWVRLGY